MHSTYRFKTIHNQQHSTNSVRMTQIFCPLEEPIVCVRIRPSSIAADRPRKARVRVQDSRVATHIASTSKGPNVASTSTVTEAGEVESSRAFCWTHGWAVNSAASLETVSAYRWAQAARAENFFLAVTLAHRLNPALIDRAASFSGPGLPPTGPDAVICTPNLSTRTMFVKQPSGETPRSTRHEGARTRAASSRLAFGIAIDSGRYENGATPRPLSFSATGHGNSLDFFEVDNFNRYWS
eukprot:scaffold111215_cov17-Prasinocladus_malaysianus.AAC.4